LVIEGYTVLQGTHMSKSGVSWPVQLNLTYLEANNYAYGHVAVYVNPEQ
jgi:hypothetical protein